jgi:hypothetical protein
MTIIGIKQSPLIYMKIGSIAAYICAGLALITSVISFYSYSPLFNSLITQLTNSQTRCQTSQQSSKRALT